MLYSKHLESFCTSALVMTWQQLAKVPTVNIGYKPFLPLALDNKEYYVLSEISENGTQYLHKYNASRNEWTSGAIDKIIPLGSDSVIIDYQNDLKKFYCIHGDGNLETVYKTRGKVRVSSCNVAMAPYASVVIDGDLHVFGEGLTYHEVTGILCHVVMNKETKFNDKNEANNVRFVDDDLLADGTAIHSEIRNSIIITGIDFFDRFVLNDEMEKDDPLMFAEYFLKSKKWDIWRPPIPQSEYPLGEKGGKVCTADGRYLISLGGRNRKRNCSKRSIIIYDLNDHSSIPTISAIKCPDDGEWHALMIADEKWDELLTLGFIRKCFKSPNMSKVPSMPTYLMQMIAKWVESEWVHLLKRRGVGHWRVRVDLILQSVNISSMKT